MSVSKNATPKALRNTYNKKGLEVFRTNLQLIENAASLFGAQLFVAKQATLIAPGLAEKDKKRCKYYYHGYDHDAHVDAFNHIYQIIKKEIDSEYIIDTTKLSGHSEYFHDHVHPTILGAQKIAEVIQNPLLSYLTQLEKFLTQIPTVVAQHQKEPKNRHVLTLLRQNRKELADYYLKMAPKKFNIELKATSKVYQLLLDSDIYNYPFTNEERNFVDNIMQEFKRFKEPKDPKYRQYLTVLTLYLREMIMVQKLMRL